jgi:hypothetical protein
MSLITLIIVLAVVGFAVWLLTTYVPMPRPIRLAIIAIVVLVLVVWVLRALGVPDVRV